MRGLWIRAGTQELTTASKTTVQWVRNQDTKEGETGEGTAVTRWRAGRRPYMASGQFWLPPDRFRARGECRVPVSAWCQGLAATHTDTHTYAHTQAHSECTEKRAHTGTHTSARNWLHRDAVRRPHLPTDLENLPQKCFPQGTGQRCKRLSGIQPFADVFP